MTAAKAAIGRSRTRANGGVALLLLFGLIGLFTIVFGASSASAFNVSNFTYSNSSLQASGHPDSVRVSFERNGTQHEDLRDIQLDLPAGVFANPESANPKCTTAQFNADTCPANSQVGSVVAEATAMSLLPLTINGSIDVLTPNSTDVATLGITLRPSKICILFVFCAVPRKVLLKNSVNIRTYGDSGLRSFTGGSPSDANIGIPLILFTPSFNADITMEKLSLTFNGRSGEAKNGAYFWRQAGSCTPATASIKLTSVQGASSSMSTSFTPTGCASVPFDPTVTFDPAVKTAGTPSPVSFKLSISEADAAIQQSTPKYVDADFPVGSALNLSALGGLTGCSEAQLQASACPASSMMGTAYAFSKYLPGANAATPGLAGKVWAMGVGSQIPIAVELLGPRGSIVIFRGTLGTRGDANVGDGRVYALFDRIPQLPFREFGLTLDVPVYKNPETCGDSTTNNSVTGFNGAVVQRTSTYQTIVCDQDPQTTITAGPPSTTPINTPRFEFESDIPTSVFQCSVDGATFVPCTTGIVTEPLPDGLHSFRVRAINGATTDPTPASYSFIVDTIGIDISPNIVVSDTQAAAHPDVDATFFVSGGQPKTISLRMPTGFNASLNAVPACDVAVAALGNCPAESRIGTGTVTVDTFSGPQVGTGEAFLTNSPTGEDAGGATAKVVFPFGTMIVQGGAYLVNNGMNQYLTLREIPTEVNGTAINVTSLNVSFSGANGFITNPSSCTHADSAWVSTGEDWAGNQASVFDVPFQATNCAAVPFNPTINQQLSNPVAGQITGVTANVGLSPGDSSIKSVRVSEPPSVAPNFPAFGVAEDQCPNSAAPTPTSIFDPSQCPPQAFVGEMIITTPLLADPLIGQVYLIENNPLPWLGVAFDQPGISVRATGVTSTPQVNPACNALLTFCQTQISIVFNNLPDVQMSTIDLYLDGPTRAGVDGPLSGRILRVASPADSTCDATTPAKAEFVSYSGQTVNIDQNVSITGCT